MTSLIRFGRWSWSWCIAIAIVALGAAFLRPAPHREGSPLTKYMVRMPAIAARNSVAILASSPVGTAATPPPAERAALERTAAIALFVPAVEPAISVLRALARARGGEIVALKDERPDVAGRPQSADVSLAVPAAAMDAALARIAALGGVRSRSETALDAGADIVDDAARLRNLRRTEADIRKIMDRSGKIGDVLEVENQLSTVRDEIERLAGAYAAVQRRVAFATIDVSLVSDAPAPAAVETPATVRLADAWRAALASVRDVSIAVAGRAFLWIAFAPYWLAAAVAILLLRTALARRQTKATRGMR